MSGFLRLPIWGLLALVIVLPTGCGTDDTGGDGAAQSGTDAALFLPSGDTTSAATTDTNAAGPDASGPSECPGSPYCPCKEHSDCDSAFCIATPDGSVCAKTCVDECQQGFLCRSVDSPGGDIVNICVPQFGKLCDPCADDGDCKALGIDGAFCVDRGQKGRFCGAPCAGDQDCPSGYSCLDKVVDGGSKKQCVPASDGDCTCSAAAIAAQLKTDCYSLGPTGGQCGGQRMCAETGLTECAVPPATKEICDGLDNDCDGKTDNLACDDENACTSDLCDPSQKDTGSSGCTHKDTTGPCDADDNACTEGDVCKAGLCTPGGQKNCDDKNPCTVDSCDPKTGCTKSNDDNKPCDDENPCTVGDSCKDASCAAGPPKVCSSTDPCVTAKCKPTNGKCDFSEKPEGTGCDDGDKCTAADACKSGNCVGSASNCDDGNACTDDACKPGGGCTNAPKLEGAPCADGKGCTTGGGCKAGSCVAGTPTDCKDSDACTVDSCDQATGKCAHKPTPGCGSYCAKASDCKDDGKPCTDATCEKDLCAHKPSVKTCDDNNPCTDNDSCVTGTCAGQPKTCEAGASCVGGQCVKSTKCAPLNLESNAKLGDLNFDKAGTIDTTSGNISIGGVGVGTGASPGVTLHTQSAAGTNWAVKQIRVMHVKNLTIAANVTVKVTGNYPLAIVATGAIHIVGVLDASGGNGGAGKPNSGSIGGAAGPGGGVGGTWKSGQGCGGTNGKGGGNGGSGLGGCGGPGGQGASGSQNGGGGGGGGGACGGAGGAGASFAENGMPGVGAAGGADGLSGSGNTNAGKACQSGPGNSSANQMYGLKTLKPLLGGSGGGHGGFGGQGGFGGKGGGASPGFGGALTFGGGGGGGGAGGGAVLLCGGQKVEVSASGKVSVRGGNGGIASGPNTPEGGKNASVVAKSASGGGGGAGRSGAGGGGGGGTGGAVYLSASQVTMVGTIDASGGLGGSGGYNFGDGGYGGIGQKGGQKGGKGGKGGTGGKGGQGSKGFIYIGSSLPANMNGQLLGAVHSGAP